MIRVEAAGLRAEAHGEAAGRALFSLVDGVAEMAEPAIVVAAKVLEEAQQGFLARAGRWRVAPFVGVPVADQDLGVLGEAVPHALKIGRGDTAEITPLDEIDVPGAALHPAHPARSC